MGLPFREGGADRRGVFCWGLVALVYRDVAGIDLPLHETVAIDDLAAVSARIGAGALVPPWTTEVPPGSERPLDVVVMSFRRLPTHVGLIVDRGFLLHAQEATCSVIVPLGDRSVSRRLLGIYRHDALA